MFINLSLATHRWIVASGDPDFWLDADSFRAVGAAMALLAFGLGIFSIRAAGHTFISRYEPRRHWLLLMGLAILVSVLRGLAELDRRGADALAGRSRLPPSARSTQPSGPSIRPTRAENRPSNPNSQLRIPTPLQRPNPKGAFRRLESCRWDWSW